MYEINMELLQTQSRLEQAEGTSGSVYVLPLLFRVRYGCAPTSEESGESNEHQWALERLLLKKKSAQEPRSLGLLLLGEHSGASPRSQVLMHRMGSCRVSEQRT